MEAVRPRRMRATIGIGRVVAAVAPLAAAAATVAAVSGCAGAPASQEGTGAAATELDVVVGGSNGTQMNGTSLNGTSIHYVFLRGASVALPPRRPDTPPIGAVPAVVSIAQGVLTATYEFGGRTVRLTGGAFAGVMMHAVGPRRGITPL